MTLCACGCGNEITPQKHHKYYHPKFIHGHNNQTYEFHDCRCGCGSKIKDSKEFKWGHNRMFPSGKLNPKWKTGKFVSKKGYVLVKRLDHPYRQTDGYVFEHRLVMEEYLNRYLLPNEEVHHINGNRQDNRIENLTLCYSHSEHMAIHYPPEQ